LAILGNIIKGVIDVGESLTSTAHHIDAQERVLHDLVDSAAGTAFGREHGFKPLLATNDRCNAFAQAVPYFDYDTIHDNWWSRQLEGEPDVTWPGTASYYALSSGTTGNASKRIPVTYAMLDAIRQAGIRQVFALSNFEMPPDFFEKEILMLGSSTDLKESEGHLEGEISGISASNIPFWFRQYYKPGEDIARIDDWDQRVSRIVEKAPGWDIGALSGIPSWMELMLQAVIDAHKLAHIHEIWPNLRVYTSGGVSFGPYKKSFNSLMGKPVTIIDTYFASEGFLAFQTRPGTTSMKLLTDNGIYFEFVPFKPEFIKEDGSLVPHAPSVGLGNVKTGQDYVLIISTVSGAWRYIIGDTIKFTDVDRAEIQITGRTKFFLNTVGSQLSVNKLDDAVTFLESRFDIRIPEYTLCAKRIGGHFFHCWYLGTEGGKDEVVMAEVLDGFLKEANKNYGVARSRALKGVKVSCISPDIFYAWNARNKKKGGQVKMERVMGVEKFGEWEDFVRTKSSAQP
jgi:hypothetical protein